MLKRPYFFILICMIGLCAASPAPAQNSDKILATEKSLDFPLYSFEIVTLRDKENTPTRKEFRFSTKPSDSLPAQTFWKLNAPQANELLAYLKKFEDLRNTETSKSGATILTRIGRIENTDLFFQLLPTTTAYLKIVDRTAPEISTRLPYNDIQAMRRLLMEFLGTSN